MSWALGSWIMPCCWACWDIGVCLGAGIVAPVCRRFGAGKMVVEGKQTITTIPLAYVRLVGTRTDPYIHDYYYTLIPTLDSYHTSKHHSPICIFNLVHACPRVWLPSHVRQCVFVLLVHRTLVPVVVQVERQHRPQPRPELPRRPPAGDLGSAAIVFGLMCYSECPSDSATDHQGSLPPSCSRFHFQLPGRRAWGLGGSHLQDHQSTPHSRYR
jgi:hypothetical protein